jgi:hypothetical protein
LGKNCPIPALSTSDFNKPNGLRRLPRVCIASISSRTGLTLFRRTPVDQFARGSQELALQDRRISDHRCDYYRIAPHRLQRL